MLKNIQLNSNHHNYIIWSPLLQLHFMYLIRLFILNIFWIVIKIIIRLIWHSFHSRPCLKKCLILYNKMIRYIFRLAVFIGRKLLRKSRKLVVRIWILKVQLKLRNIIRLPCMSWRSRKGKEKCLKFQGKACLSDKNVRWSLIPRRGSPQKARVTVRRSQNPRKKQIPKIGRPWILHFLRKKSPAWHLWQNLPSKSQWHQEARANLKRNRAVANHQSIQSMTEAKRSWRRSDHNKNMVLAWRQIHIFQGQTKMRRKSSRAAKKTPN